MEKIDITRGTTRAILHLPIQHMCAPHVRQVTSEILTDYQWDPVIGRRVSINAFSQYNHLSKNLHIPINALSYILEMLDSVGAHYEVVDEEPYPQRDIKLKMRKGFKPREDQGDIIEYLANDMPHRKGLATATGSGKTVSTIAGLVKYGKAAVIIVSGLQDQWIRQLKHFTNIKDRVYLVQGYQSLIRLMESEFKPDVIVFSLETLRLYVSGANHYKNLPRFHQFLKYFGIGFKVMDEVHMNFHAQTMIDLNANVHNNVYLTATFNATNLYTRKVMNIIYPPHMRYGEHEFIKYIDVVCYLFRGDVPESACMRQRGYMHTKYEQHLLKRKHAIHRFFNDILMMIIQEQYILKRKPGDKMMVYFSRRAMAETALVWFTKMFPNLKSAVYIGGIKDDVLEKTDIVISTPKKGGTGTDVKDLLFVLNTVSFQTVVATEQLRGRLRQLKDGRTPTYAELVDTRISAQERHRFIRSYVHKTSAKSYKIFRI